MARIANRSIQFFRNHHISENLLLNIKKCDNTKYYDNTFSLFQIFKNLATFKFNFMLKLLLNYLFTRLYIYFTKRISFSYVLIASRNWYFI